MLLHFRMLNYRSFKDETILDMSSSSVSEFSNTLIKLGRKKYLPTAIVFGANAGGKSNLMAAFDTMIRIVRDSLNYRSMDSEPWKSMIQFYIPGYSPFAFDLETQNKDTEFEAWFTVPYNGREIVLNYGFSWDGGGIHEEWLYRKSISASDYQPIFTRNGISVEYYSDDINRRIQASIQDGMAEQVLISSFGSIFSCEILQAVYRFFVSSQVLGAETEGQIRLPRDFMTDQHVRDSVLSYLQVFDRSIIGFDIDETTQYREAYRNVKTLHRMNASDKIGKIPLEEESAGTLKVFSLYQNLIDALEKGSVLWIDEINSHLHPLLVRSFILNFIKPELNPKHAQLIATTHDSWMLESGILRRDEVWFTEKDDDGKSILYSLTDFKDPDGSRVRKDDQIANNYLLGVYGAVPNLNSFFVSRERKE